MGCIYMRISPSGGKYIGQTIYSEEERWKQHSYNAYHSNSSEYNTLLSQAIRKYGANNFSVKILENDIKNKNDLNQREIFWINYYKTYFYDDQHGYNMTRGGDGIKLYNFSDEELNELWLKGQIVSELKDFFHCSDDTIYRRLKSLGYTSEDIKNQMRIQRYDKNYILQLWSEGKTLSDIALILNTDRHTIADLLKFYNISGQEIKNQKYKKISQIKNKPIYQLNSEGKILKEWPSAKEAANNLHLDFSSIRKCIKGIRKTCGGFQWKEKII